MAKAVRAAQAVIGASVAGLEAVEAVHAEVKMAARKVRRAKEPRGKVEEAEVKALQRKVREGKAVVQAGAFGSSA